MPNSTRLCFRARDAWVVSHSTVRAIACRTTPEVFAHSRAASPLFSDIPGHRDRFLPPPHDPEDGQTVIRGDEPSKEDRNHDEEASRRKDRSRERGNGVAVHHSEQDGLIGMD